MAKSKSEQIAAKERRAELAREVGKMAKTANQRLRELEKQDFGKASNAYRYMERLHYDKDNATATDAQGRMKFNTNFRGKTYQDIQHEAAELSRFLAAKTSTKTGVDEKYLKGYETLKRNNPEVANMSYPEFCEMMRSQTMKKLKSAYGSDVIVRMSKRLSEGEKWKDAESKIEGTKFEETPWLKVEDALNVPSEWKENDTITDNDNITE